MKKIVVTGGAGFVGSHLVDRLLAEGHAVTCVDNFVTGRRRNVEQHAGNSRFTLIEHDVISPRSFEADEIFHLACPASPVHYQADPVFTLKTSVFGTLNLLESAERYGARLLFASTSEVYGDPLEHPQRESYWGHVNPNGIRSCYDEGKRAAETLCMDFHRRRNTAVRVVRIFNTYGPRMLPDDGRVVSNFIVQALTGSPLTVFGDGLQTRSFCYVDDLVDGLVRMMASSEVGPINLGNPEEFTVQALADRVLTMTGSAARIDRRPLPQDDPTRRRPDITLATTKLGWRPRVALEEGLSKTIAYFKSEALPARK